jgi:hypothetical protein
MKLFLPLGRIFDLKTMAWIALVCSASISLAQMPSQASDPMPACKVLDAELASARYRGPCHQGLAHGQGRVIALQAGDAAYVGNFEAGRKHGQGRKTFANGDVYEGQWQDDLRAGHGRYVYGAQSPWSGDVYEGQWRADKMHGQGTYQWWRNERYSGPWAEGRPSEEATGGQARRAAYLAAFMTELEKTAGRVCATGRSASDPLSMATGWVKASVADRIWVEWPDGAGRSWQLVSHWRPCR